MADADHHSDNDIRQALAAADRLLTVTTVVPFPRLAQRVQADVRAATTRRWVARAFVGTCLSVAAIAMLPWLRPTSEPARDVAIDVRLDTRPTLPGPLATVQEPSQMTSPVDPAASSMAAVTLSIQRELHNVDTLLSNLERINEAERLRRAEQRCQRLQEKLKVMTLRAPPYSEQQALKLYQQARVADRNPSQMALADKLRRRLVSDYPDSMAANWLRSEMM